MALYLRGQIGRERKKKYLSLLNSAVLQARPRRPVGGVVVGVGAACAGRVGVRLLCRAPLRLIASFGRPQSTSLSPPQRVAL